MNIYNFDDETDEWIRERGANYYLDNAVTGLRETQASQWEAKVQGRMIYDVMVRLQDDGEITEWQCNCPYGGEICKHVVAVLYSLNDLWVYTGADTPKVLQPPTPLQWSEAILKKLEEEQLRQWVQKQLGNNGMLLNALLMDMGLQDDSIPASGKYHWIVKWITENCKGERGYIGYHRAGEWTEHMLRVVQHGALLLEQGQWQEALWVVKAVMEKTPVVAYLIDNTMEGIEEVWQAAVAVAMQLVASAEEASRDSLFAYYQIQLAQTRYGKLDGEVDVLQLLAALARTEEQGELLLRTLHQQIQKARKERAEEDKLEELLQLAVAQLQKRGQSKQALALMKANMEIPAVRDSLIEHYRHHQDFEQALELCRAGIEAAPKGRYGQQLAEYYRHTQLEIAKEAGDEAKVCQAAEDMLLTEMGAMEHYELMRQHWPAETWESKRGELLDKMHAQCAGQGGKPMFTLAQGLLEEHLWDRMLALFAQPPIQLAVVDRYARQLATHYPQEVLQLYRTGILAISLGGNAPADILRYLRRMVKLPGGTAASHSIVAALREKHKAHKKLMDMIDNHFEPTDTPLE